MHPKQEHDAHAHNTAASQMSIAEVQRNADQHQKYLGDPSQALPDLDPIHVSPQDPPMPESITQVTKTTSVFCDDRFRSNLFALSWSTPSHHEKWHSL